MNYVTVYSLISIYSFHSVLLKCTPQRQMSYFYTKLRGASFAYTFRYLPRWHF